jgi:NAD(P)-dependent dehydrogenase (short-subunit alcohol dehydrogenase family)
MRKVSPVPEYPGSTAVVTGGGGEIGRATALALAKVGVRVLVVDHDLDKARDAVAAVTQAGGTAEAFRADVGDEESTRSYARAGADFGQGSIDMFFNNAGIEGRVSPIVDSSADDFDRVLRVNVRGMFLGMKHVVGYMPDKGAIVNNASTAAFRGSQGMAAYVSSKHAVIGLTKVAALEFAAREIRVVAVCPSAVEGRMMQSLDSQKEARVANAESGGNAPGKRGVSARPFGRYCTPEEIAEVVVYVLGPHAGYMSGIALPIDGAGMAGG